ncbi:MAG: hypothetical protein ABI988_14375 [Nitrospirota bacterium]
MWVVRRCDERMTRNCTRISCSTMIEYRKGPYRATVHQGHGCRTAPEAEGW